VTDCGKNAPPAFEIEFWKPTPELFTLPLGPLSGCETCPPPLSAFLQLPHELRALLFRKSLPPTARCIDERGYHTCDFGFATPKPRLPASARQEPKVGGALLRRELITPAFPASRRRAFDALLGCRGVGL
jgi:hypothetical protein